MIFETINQNLFEISNHNFDIGNLKFETINQKKYE